MPPLSTPGPAGSSLPVLDVAPELLAALEQRRSAVLVAPPGTGKTTGLPPVLAASPWASGGRIVVVEPRRLATRAAAARMATTTGTELGGLVGYSVRGERRVGASTRIEVVTTGLFLRRLQADPTLDGVAVVLLDEFHERSVEVDLALALLIDVRSALRPELAVLVMSATIDPTPVAHLLGGADGPAPVVLASAPAFPVETRHRPGSAHDPIEQRVAQVVQESLRTDDGDVLVFLPGRGEIRRTRQLLERADLPADRLELTELHGSLSPAEQDHVVRPPEPGRRRVILATSLAETSVTVPGVRVVIDAGRRRRQVLDPHTGLPGLRTTAVSRAGADQRRGRAGRVAPGVAYRLWSADEERHRPALDDPEVSDGDLASLVLQLRAWGVGSPAEMAWLDPPPAHAVARAEQLLVALGAIEDDGRLGAQGRAIAEVGVHPRIGAMVLAARRLGGEAAAVDVVAVDVVAAVEAGRWPSPDLSAALGRLHDGTAPEPARQAQRLWRRSLGVAREAHDTTPAPDDELLARLVLAGYPDRIAHRRSGTRDDGRGRPSVVYHLRTGGEVALRTDDPLARHEWLVVLDLDAGPPGGAGRVHLAAPVPDRVVADVVEPWVTSEDVVEWDPRGAELVTSARRRLGSIVLGSAPLPQPDRELLVAAWRDALADRGPALLPRWPESEPLRRRMAFLRAVRPDDGWPDWSEQALGAEAPGWWVERFVAARRVSALRSIDVAAVLRDQLDWAQRRTLDEWAPTHWTTPTGRRVPLRYGEVDGEPATVLASARLSDLIGTDEHPTVGPDRRPVTLELRSPADRPVQRTEDLPGFWRGSYAAVRTELRGRYPKHPWPERPWQPLPPSGRRR